MIKLQKAVKYLKSTFFSLPLLSSIFHLHFSALMTQDLDSKIYGQQKMKNSYFFASYTALELANGFYAVLEKENDLYGVVEKLSGFFFCNKKNIYN